MENFDLGENTHTSTHTHTHTLTPIYTAEKAYLAAIQVSGKPIDDFANENITTTFNLARLYEALSRTPEAKRSVCVHVCEYM